MKIIAKMAILASFFAIAGCTGTQYNAAKSCSEDYLLHPAISVPAWIGACDNY